MTAGRLPLTIIFATLMIDAMGIGLILPVLPDLLREVDGGNLADAARWGGLLTTVFALMQFCFAPLLGALSDRFGRRPVILVSSVVLAIDYILVAVAGSIWLLFVARVIGGIASATQSTATAYIADISTPEQKAARFGLVGAAFGLGFVIGPVIGGVLADFGTRAPFYAAAGLALLNFLVAFFFLPESVTDATRRALEWRRANPFGAFLHARSLKGIQAMIVMFFVYQVAFNVYPSIWAYYTKAQFGWSNTMVGVSLASFGIAMAVVQGLLIGRIIDRYGTVRTIAFGLMFNAFAFAVLSSVTNGWAVLLFTPVTALGAVVTPALQGTMSKIVPDDAQGELQGLVSSAMSLAMIFAPLVMTGIFAQFTDDNALIFMPGAPFLLSMMLMGVCAWLFPWRAAMQFGARRKSS